MKLVIAFDADDTLWHNESDYTNAQEVYLAGVAAYGVSRQAALAVLDQTDLNNLPSFGYGLKSFTLSMIQAAIEVSQGRIQAAEIRAILDAGRAMTALEVRLLEGAREAVTALSASHTLLLITKGELLDQQRKVHKSGLEPYFSQVEVVSDKTVAVYQALLERRGIPAQQFLMVGNSPRSDILPVLALGGHAAYVPYATTWAHETVAELPPAEGRYHQLENLWGLEQLVAKIELE